MRSSPYPVDVTVHRQIAAPPGAVYDLVSDVTRMGEWSPETVSARWVDQRDEQRPVAVGARFRGRNRIGRLAWSTVPSVTAADPGRRFAFRVPGRAGTAWTYTFEAVDGGTLVTEHALQEHPSPALIRFLQRRAGVTDRAAHLRDGMIVTLDRLATHVGSRTTADRTTADRVAPDRTADRPTR